MKKQPHPFPRSEAEARKVIQGYGREIEKNISDIYRKSEKSVEALKFSPQNSKGTAILTAVVATAAVLGTGILIARTGEQRSWSQRAEKSKTRHGEIGFSR